MLVIYSIVGLKFHSSKEEPNKEASVDQQFVALQLDTLVVEL